ncbi:2-C-methyl-D-erythritol 4-phosphate cytidylyltransferase [Thermogemmatispora sp.]|uniref:2-C-methyl-D-erythritol 4-phosphate cytidylyltransferase n=1 Tax=Thermogemmatispora sp. TaxID=1968838 RepID=UPI001E054E77|nr:2-C-methyl-D-erythritol 4-phosphate cytidylyltransferase [Thermogemmatispora sp.]MBX5450737.1 2-C-methyl-D-erythritol 4-phosphate cytidylyltransferase [Thermogemmatispora sp.]
MQERAAVVIVAAGSSRRMAGRDKLWTPLAGRLTLARTVDVFEACPLIQAIVLVVHPTREADSWELLAEEGWRKVIAVVAGGPRRQDSVRVGLEALARHLPDTQWVLVHDGARPFVSSSLIEAGLQAARLHQAAVAAVPVKDTLKVVEGRYVCETPERARLWVVQTPQVFAFSLLWEAHHARSAQAGEEEVSDDAALVESLGYRVAIFPGSYTNMKITTQEDFLLAEYLVQQETGLR